MFRILCSLVFLKLLNHECLMLGGWMEGGRSGDGGGGGGCVGGGGGGGGRGWVGGKGC